MREMGIEVKLKQVLHMKEGNGDTSYAKASYIQKKALSLSKSIKEEAIKEFYKNNQASNNRSPITSLWIADLGCSSVELNKVSPVYELIDIVEKICKQLGINAPLEYQLALNDLPNNDFNTVFKSLPSFEDLLKHQMGVGFGHCLVGVFPGSFYGRLFPTNTLHFVHSSYSLHWLSQVPRGIEENKGHIYIGKASTPKVLNAYFDQFQEDFLSFLRSRSKEVVPGGMMVLTMLGKRDNEPYCKESSHAYDLLDLVLNDMVKEGYIEEDELNTFNLPMYEPSPAELEYLVRKEGSFNITHVELFKINWISNEFGEYDFIKCMRSVFEPLLISHFGNSIMDQLFESYQNLIYASSAIEESGFITNTISMSRKG